MPAGVTLVTPDDIRRLTPAEVDAMKDAQLKKALEVVDTEPAPN
jgi:hypothetical protein